VFFPDGHQRRYFLSRKNAELTAEDLALRSATDQEFEILRSDTRKGIKTLILGGVNPKPANDAADAHIATEMKNYLVNAGKEYQTLWGKKVQGADTAKPQFIHLGFHFPHTPVLPPKSFRDRFKTKKYRVPDFDQEELNKLSPQLVRLYQSNSCNGMTEGQKQQAIEDYYAFAPMATLKSDAPSKPFKRIAKKQIKSS
jgi:hypothetical protein